MSARSPRTFVVESYQPGPAALSEIAARASRAAAELSRRGKRVRYVRSILVPDDETGFHVFEACSAEDARTAGQCAGLDPQRVSEAVV